MELAHPRAGETVLVHSAAGGVGSALVQLAANAGCRVIGVVGAPDKREVALALGAGVVIDKSSEDLWGRVEAVAPAGCGIILDANGARSISDSYSHLAPTGRLVVYGFHSMLPKKGGRPNWLQLAIGWLQTPRFNPLSMTTENRSVLAFNLSFLGNKSELLRRGLTWLVGELDAGRLEPPRVTTFPFENVADAHRALSGDGRGQAGVDRGGRVKRVILSAAKDLGWGSAWSIAGPRILRFAQDDTSPRPRPGLPLPSPSRITSHPFRDKTHNQTTGGK